MYLPKPLTPDEVALNVKMAVMKAEGELRDRLASDAMVAAIAADCTFFQSPETIRRAGSRFYALAQAMIEARRAIRL
jgi:hypothetical protein